MFLWLVRRGDCSFHACNQRGPAAVQPLDGRPSANYRDAACGAFGNVTRTREDARAVWTRGRLDDAAAGVARTRERRAARGPRGAARARAVVPPLGHGLKLACAGLVAGLASALVLTRLMETMLFAVRPNDPVTLAGVAALIAAVAAAASPIPALRATRVDPLVALKHE
jgi:hypothetical protein